MPCFHALDIAAILLFCFIFIILPDIATTMFTLPPAMLASLRHAMLMFHAMPILLRPLFSGCLMLRHDAQRRFTSAITLLLPVSLLPPLPSPAVFFHATFRQHCHIELDYRRHELITIASL